MAIIHEQPARTVILYAHCECGSEFERVEGVNPGPLGVLHECMGCGKQEWLGDFYPKIASRPLNRKRVRSNLQEEVKPAQSGRADAPSTPEQKAIDHWDGGI